MTKTTNAPTTYSRARIADAMDGSTVEKIETPTMAAAKAALRQWMQAGDTFHVHHRDDGLMTVVQIVCGDGETSDVFAQLSI
jgi:hypothetical protein